MSDPDPTTADTVVDLSSSYNEARREAPKTTNFLKGELGALWPVLTLAVLMMAIILWDRFIRF